MIDVASDDVAARGLVAVARAASRPEKVPAPPAPLTAEEVRAIVREELIAAAAIVPPSAPPLAGVDTHKLTPSEVAGIKDTFLGRFLNDDPCVLGAVIT